MAFFSSGMANAFASENYMRQRKLWNDQRRDEELNRYYSSVADQMTREQLVEEQAQADASASREVLEQYQSAIRRGDKEAFVRFLNDNIVRTGGYGAKLVDGVAWELDENGEPARALYDISKATADEMVGEAQKYTNTIQENNITRTASIQDQLKRQGEIDLAVLKGDYDLAGRLMSANAQLQTAQMYAGATLQAAQARAAAGSGGGNALTPEDQLQYDMAMQRNIGNTAATSINPAFSYDRDDNGNFGLVQIDPAGGKILVSDPAILGDFQNRYHQLQTMMANNPGNLPIGTAATQLSQWNLANLRQHVMDASYGAGMSALGGIQAAQARDTAAAAAAAERAKWGDLPTSVVPSYNGSYIGNYGLPMLMN